MDTVDMRTEIKIDEPADLSQGCEGQGKFDDVKKKAEEFKGRFAEKFSETAETARVEGKKKAQQALHKTQEVGSSIGEAISENLFPVILTAVGAAWLITGLLRKRSNGYETEYDIDYSAEGQEHHLGLGEKAKEISRRAREESEHAREKARELTRRAREESLRTKEKSKDIVINNPFYVAGAFAAAGLLLGLTFPETRRETRLYDEIRKDVKEGEPFTNEFTSGGFPEAYEADKF